MYPSLAPTEPTTSTPAKTMLSNLPAMLLASTVGIPTSGNFSGQRSSGILISTRDPLSIPITTANFRRFVSKVGPIFWLQDRIEEILTWKRGWKVTTVWMAVYAFLCFFPRLILLIPNTLLVAILLSTYPTRVADGSQDAKNGVSPAPSPQVFEGTAVWQANLQGIQNLMGFVSDVDDAILSLLPHLTYQTPYTPLLLTTSVITLLLSIPLVYLVPFRLAALFLGLFPFFFTHPFAQSTLLPAVNTTVISPSWKAGFSWFYRILDDDKLEDKHWRAELRQVEVFENERWNPHSREASGSTASAISGLSGSGLIGWGKYNLKSGERKAWTRGRDGWSGVAEGGDVSSCLTFALDEGWSFVETEDWRPDITGSWSPCGADDSGWIYTNDAWLDPRPTPLEEWKTLTGGMTRRRRWTHRIYYTGSPTDTRSFEFE
ncbi:hypothetical protein BDM02DRAFT_3100075 [Thelephora ganbajun]|uniref:Uncharacterized protein n=1 Tax=Thelephora ganbajun TaxID=370292 RepID=A0ACB6Z978_THEGA|nr:hypothetical protein BDM02DRAFT_3100075 [Thelephora ganbajun]